MTDSRVLLGILCAFLVTAGGLEAQSLRRTEEAAERPLYAELHRLLPRAEDSAVALGDADGDGDVDAMVGARLHLNDGSGVLVEASENLEAFDPRALALVMQDMDMDGDLDVVMGHQGPNGLYLNDGSGMFTDASSMLPPHAEPTQDLATGDAEMDGDPDLFVANKSAGNTPSRLYLNDGMAAFTDGTANLPAIFNNGAIAIAVGDVDGDGYVDVLTGSHDRFMHAIIGVRNRLWLNDRTGRFRDFTARLTAVSDATFDVGLADVDGDMDLDAFIANGGNFKSGEQSLLYLNDGSGNFTDATVNLPADNAKTIVSEFVDFEGDGDPDLFLGNDGQDQYYENVGGVFTEVPGVFPPSTQFTRGLAIGDLDGDGDGDAVAARSNPVSRNALFLNDGTDSFVDVTAEPAWPENDEETFELAAGDVNGDGYVDVYAVTKRVNRLFLNDGFGAFEDASANLPPVPKGVEAVAMADVDADGDTDVLVGGHLRCGVSSPSAAKRDALLLNDGTGVFSDGTSQLPGIAHDTAAIAFLDMEGDGDADALVGNLLFRNDGAGNFGDASGRLPAGFSSSCPSADDYAVGDVDLDGSLDILVGGRRDGLFLNDGMGNFVDATGGLPTPVSGQVRAVALGDLDGDGFPEAVVGIDRFYRPKPPNSSPTMPVAPSTEPSGQHHVYANEGGGSFSIATPDFPDVMTYVTDLAVRDVDGDGTRTSSPPERGTRSRPGRRTGSSSTTVRASSPTPRSCTWTERRTRRTPWSSRTSTGTATWTCFSATTAGTGCTRTSRSTSRGWGGPGSATRSRSRSSASRTSAGCSSPRRARASVVRSRSAAPGSPSSVPDGWTPAGSTRWRRRCPTTRPWWARASSGRPSSSGSPSRPRTSRSGSSRTSSVTGCQASAR